MKEFKLKKGMLIGSASAATQIEGGALDHSWMDWAKQGKITDNCSPARANDHFRLWQEDTLLMGELKMQICRLGIEWARIEPEEGIFSEAAIAHYIREIEFIKTQGIKVLVTLHHFTNPMWFERRGAFEKKQNIAFFIRFVEKIVRSFGVTVNEYITINEPNVYAVNGYYFGTWPPGKKGFSSTLTVMSCMAKAHLQAYRRIHEIRTEMGFSNTMVSFANHLRVFTPENPNKLSHRFITNVMAFLFQGWISKKMGKSCDFHALNYYTRSTVSGFRDGVKKGAYINDLGWEIHPQGIVKCARKLYDLIPLPIYITENGTCDNDDVFRPLYLYEHLKILCESDLPIERYYHWCFCDNFEWVEGESARFGLVHVDYETQKRTIKKSGVFLREVIEKGGVDAEVYAKYVDGVGYVKSN